MVTRTQQPLCLRLAPSLLSLMQQILLRQLDSGWYKHETMLRSPLWSQTFSPVKPLTLQVEYYVGADD